MTKAGAYALWLGKVRPPCGDAACPLITFSRNRAELDTPPTTQGGKLARFLSYPDPKQAVLPDLLQLCSHAVIGWLGFLIGG